MTKPKTIWIDYNRKWYHFQNGTRKHPFESFTKAVIAGDCKMICEGYFSELYPEGKDLIYFYENGHWRGEGGGYHTNDPDHFIMDRIIDAAARND